MASICDVARHLGGPAALLAGLVPSAIALRHAVRGRPKHAVVFVALAAALVSVSQGPAALLGDVVLAVAGANDAGHADLVLYLSLRHLAVVFALFAAGAASLEVVARFRTAPAQIVRWRPGGAAALGLLVTAAALPIINVGTDEWCGTFQWAVDRQETPIIWVADTEPKRVAAPFRVRRLVLNGMDGCALDLGGGIWCWNVYDPKPRFVRAFFDGVYENFDLFQGAICGLSTSGRWRCQWLQGAPIQLPESLTVAEDLRISCDGLIGLTAGGSVLAWQWQAAAPVMVTNGASSISARFGCGGCATDATGVVCWAGPAAQRHRVEGESGARLTSSETQTCGVGKDGGPVRCWDHRFAASEIAPLPRVAALALSSNHGCAIGEDATLHCWGDNGWGQLGDGTRARPEVPASVGGISGLADIAATEAKTCAADREGTLWCWGRRRRFERLCQTL